MRLKVSLALAVVTAHAVPNEVGAQVFVFPRRADKAQVRRFDFQWRYVDIVPPSGAGAPASAEAGERPGAGPEAGPGAPGRPAPGAPAPGGAPPQVGAGGNPAETPAPTSPGGGPGGLPAPEQPALDGDAAQPDGAGAAAPKPGGIRLYFYEREKEIAELAVPLILDAYTELAERFSFTPTERFPYILYNTYQEFLETRLFPVQEGVLGVTSPIDLTLTLPYFGDHRMFHEVSTHEMAHQFTIQKLRELGRREKTGSAIDKLPLWFIEGLAEFYAQRGIDPETEMLARDIVVNPDGERGYALLDFFEDRPGSVLWTYKLGQARVAFLEDTYGAGITQRILERAHMLGGSRSIDGRRLDFARLLERISGDSQQVLAARFADWLKRRAYKTYLGASQSPSTLKPLSREPAREPVFGLASSPDGNLLVYRRIDLNTGQTQLVLTDRRDPRRARVVVGDGVPGAESLHPIAPRNFAVGDRALIYVAQIDSRDVIYRQEIEATAELRAAPRDQPGRMRPWSPSPTDRARMAASRREAEADARSDEDREWDVRVSLGASTYYDLGALVSADSPALSPDGRRIAFVGTDEKGMRDVYLLTPGGERHDIRRLTNDRWAERQVSWGKDGVVFTSDATETRKFNLFRVDPDGGGAPERLTTEDRDNFDPLATAEGRVFYVAYQDARADVHEVVKGQVVRRSDIATGLTDVGTGPDDGLWALWLHGGQRIPVRIAGADLLGKPVAAGAPGATPAPLVERPVDGATRYDVLAVDNWKLGPVFGLIGAGGGSIVGQLYGSATDLMRDHLLVLNLEILGSLELTNGILLYINQENRIGSGAGLFQDITYRYDRSLQNEIGPFASLERYFGVIGLVRLPFSTFRYLQGSLAVGAARHFLFPGDENYLAAVGLLDEWRDRNRGLLAQAEARLSFGHDTLRYHPLTGPLSGTSFLVEVTATGQSRSDALFGEARADLARHVALGGSANFLLRGGVGTSYGGRFARQFYLSSFDTLRGVRLDDDEYLLGRHFFFSTAELQFPLSSIVRVVFLPNIEGVAGLDFGAAANRVNDLWPKRVLNGVLGVNFVFGPIVFRMHFAKPIDVNARPEEAGVARSLDRGWVTNLSLNWLDF